MSNRKQLSKDINIDALVSGIIVQAVKDYKACTSKLKKKPKNQEALIAKRELERFFYSDWFAMLSDLDPEKLLKKLNKI